MSAKNNIKQALAVFKGFGKKDVVIHNTFNYRFLVPLTSSEQNILYAIFHKIRDEKKDRIIITKREIINQALRQEGGGEAVPYDEFLSNVCYKLGGLVLRHNINDESVEQFSLFPKIHYSNQAIVVTVSDSFIPFLSSYGSNITAFNLDEFVSIRGKYAKILYRLLKQYYFLGTISFPLESLCRYLCLANESGIASKVGRIIERAIRVLSPTKDDDPMGLYSSPPFHNLTFIPRKKGRSIDNYLFKWEVPESSFFNTVKDAEIFRKWLIQNIDSGEAYTNIFEVEGSVLSIADFKLIDPSGDFLHKRFVLNFDRRTKKEEIEIALEKIFNGIKEGNIEHFLVKKEGVESHSHLLEKYFSNTFSYNYKALLEQFDISNEPCDVAEESKIIDVKYDAFLEEAKTLYGVFFPSPIETAEIRIEDSICIMDLKKEEERYIIFLSKKDTTKTIDYPLSLENGKKLLSYIKDCMN